MEDNLGQQHTWHIAARKQRVLGPLLLAMLAGIFYLDWYYAQSSTSTKESETPVMHPKPTVPTIVAIRNEGDDDPLPECKHPSRSFGNDTTVQEVRGWHRVDPRSDWYVYSAHPDNRLSVPVVRIITLSKDDAGSSRLLYCLFWHGEKNLTPVRAQKRELWIRAWDSARPGQYYHPFLLTCPVPEDSPPISAVSVLVEEPCSRPNHRILLTASPRQPSSDNSGDFVVCLKSLNFVRDVSARLLEWLELQYLLGADTIYAYVHRLHPTTWKVLEHYRRLGKFDWQNYTGIPEEASSRSSEAGRPEGGKPSHRVWQKRRYEMATYNDCFYRHLHSHRFVVNLDLDEAIVPVLGDSWSELMASDEDPPPSASLSVRNVYFFDTFGEVDDVGIPRHMRMLRHVVRSSNFTPPGFAQKSFFSTRLAEVVSNHYALKSVRPDVRLLTGMDARVARLHHYRSECPPLMQKECEENYMRFRERDTLLWKFKDRLVANVLSRMRQLGLTHRDF